MENLNEKFTKLLAHFIESQKIEPIIERAKDSLIGDGVFLKNRLMRESFLNEELLEMLYSEKFISEENYNNFRKYFGKFGYYGFEREE